MNRSGFVRRWSTSFLLAAGLLVGTDPAAAGHPTLAPQPPPELQPVRIVVLVDESGSLNAADIAAERDAARIIALGEPSQDSTVSVLGFASADGPGQVPVDPVCAPVRLTPQNRQLLADCIGLLRRRTPAQGEGTDHLTALRQALSDLRDPAAAGQPKIVYLLTDGKLDVRHSPAYGGSPGARAAAARQQIPGLLDELRRAGVQVWPLGFGRDIDRAQLDGFATGAAQDRCGYRTPAPQATVITSSGDLLRAIAAASRAARCVAAGEPVTGELPAGGSLDLEVEVPAIATEGSILVFKRDPRVTVRYLDPDGTAVPVDGGLGISRFSLSGQNTEAEALRMVNPEPGRWTVRLSAPPGVPTLDVGATAIFQGAIRAGITVSPPAPRPGSTADVTMTVHGSRAAITDPALLRGLAFTAELSGDGFAPLAPVELADGNGDGLYQGPITVPDSATGRLQFLGSVTGAGVSGDRRPFHTRISRGGAPVQARLTLDPDPEVVIGTELAGSATVSNSTGQSRTLRLEVTGQSPGTVVSAAPARLTVPPSGQRVLPFTVRFDPATALGPNQARLRLVDETDGALVGELLFARDVVPPPTLLESLWWLWALIAAALAAGAGVVVLRARRQRAHRDVLGIRVELRRHGVPTGTAVQARRHGAEFRFGIHRGDGADVALLTGPGGERYRVHRGPGGPALRDPAGELVPGGVLELGDGLQIAVLDRPAAGPARPGARRSGNGAAPGRRPAAGGGGTRPRPSYDPYANADPGDRPDPPEDPGADNQPHRR